MNVESITEEKSDRKLKLILGLMFFIIVLGLLIMYWVVPYESLINLMASNGEYLSCSDYKFGNISDMQFYENMRYVDSEISYRIENCSIQKRIEMKNAFYEVENKTILSFFEVAKDEEILVSCDSKDRIENGLFIAGEGGPSNITKLDSSHVILNGKVLLIRESICERPVVAIHELFHALGFTHSNNICNIMYNFSKCSQDIGEDMITLISELYSSPQKVDLMIFNLTGYLHDEYLDLNFSLKNNGLLNSKNSFVKIYSNEKLIKEIELEGIQFGSGIEVALKNIKIGKKIDEVLVKSVYEFDEMDKGNNDGVLVF